MLWQKLLVLLKQTGTILGGLNILRGDQIFKAMSEIFGPVGPNISTIIEIFGPGGQNIMGDQISCDKTIDNKSHNVAQIRLLLTCASER